MPWRCAAEDTPAGRGALRGRSVKQVGFALLLLLGAVGCQDTENIVEASPSPLVEPTQSESPSPAPETATTTVPDLVGKALPNARKLLDRAGLVAVITEELSREREGTVLGQGRAPGVTVDEGLGVSLIVAEPYPVIPNVVGDKVARARRALENEGFDVRVRREVSSQPRDTVISQSPLGGTEARPGRQVTLVVAKPAPPSETSGGNCTPGYSPCLPPASDYDCIGGSGDGPEYTGRVTVTGSDPYGLDSDNDGVGCE